MCLTGLVRDDVDQAVASLVLATNRSANVGADTYKDHGQVLDRILLRVQAAENRESAPVVDVPAETCELGTEGGQKEVVFVDLGAIQSEFCSFVVSAFTPFQITRGWQAVDVMCRAHWST